MFFKEYAGTNDRVTFVEGATEFRNLRDLADEERKKVIAAANATRQSRDDAPEATAVL